MDALRVIADDLTGACDVGAELLPWPGGVVVQPLYSSAAPVGCGAEALCVRNTQSRTLPAPDAARRVTAALADVGPTWPGIVLKKIDTGLRGPLGAEIDAAMDQLGADEAFVLAAIPEVGRTTQNGRQTIAGVPVDQTAFARDPQNPIGEAHVPSAIEATARRRAASIALDAVRDGAGFLPAVEAARGRGAAVLVCDAETDADVERAVRGLLKRARPLLLVGSTGLARALRRVLGTEQVARPRRGPQASAATTGVLVVMGSAHPTAHAQVERAAARGVLTPIVVGEGGATPQEAALAAGRCVQAGRAAVLMPLPQPAAGGSAQVLSGLRSAALAALARVRPSGLALVGGETAFQVLDGLGHPPLALEARLSPLVVRSRLTAGPYGGLPLVTKGGSSGAQDLLGAIVRQLGGGR